MNEHNTLVYEMNRLNITPVELIEFNALSKNKAYRFPKLTPEEFANIKPSDKRSIELAIRKMTKDPNFVLDIDTWYKKVLNVYHKGGEVLKCNECNATLVDRDLLRNKYSQEICPHCYSEDLAHLED
jgi:hypothetical protein